MKNFKVAILGRPNVGKSTFYNRLIGKKHAIVDDLPGVTRDWREGTANLGPLKFTVIDTAGIEDRILNEVDQKIRNSTLNLLPQVNLILFVCDAKVGIIDQEIAFIKKIRNSAIPIVLVANKCESSFRTVDTQEFYKLGLGEPVFISAEHGLGMIELFDAVNFHFEKTLNLSDFVDKNPEEETIQIAIVGRPNAGKSTLVNQLLQFERMVTGDTPGITRDSIAIDYRFDGRNIKLVDTAGIKKRTSIQNQLEKIVYEDSKRAIHFAHVVVLVIDATCAFEKQDLAIAQIAITEGRSLVVAVNKWDKIADKSRFNNALVDSIASLLPEVKDVPIIYISALSGHNINLLMKASLESYDNWNIRINTGDLNQWLKVKTEHHPIPLAPNDKKVRIKYVTQYSVRPPSFVLFSNMPDAVADHYVRYLANNLKKDFSLAGVPVRLHLKSSKNPYKN